MISPNAYTVTILTEPPMIMRTLFRARDTGYGVTVYDYVDTNLDGILRVQRSLTEYGINGAIKPPANTRSTSARAVTF